MNRFFLLQLVIIFCFSIALSAQIIPKDYDTLNFRLVGFSVPENKNATAYVLEVHKYFPQDIGGYESKLLNEMCSNFVKM